MNTLKIKYIIVFVFFSQILFSQKVSGVYKINDLLNRLKNKDTTYVVNFWATWCKPCVKELPAFDSLEKENKYLVKVILVSLDFKEDIDKKINPFLEKNKVKTQVVILDEVNGNDYINKISTEWTGAIPATYFKNKKKEIFAEQKVNLNDLHLNLEELNKK
ncbi:MAG: TlpA family protein disulfide reductase [Bacteroidetes bacterium]|nr:TlpA family protein disulfide reductase [Bacteroidota bacterium]